ncbi:MAG: S9 family peptidase [Flavobacteriaceae bacterium]|nr:S9 family peptidase [Flavobacteriaceae bacterium]
MKKSLLLMIILLHSCDMKKNEIIEPRAEKTNKIITAHNHERIDEFYWLNERGNPKVIDYLNSENDYRNSYIKDYKGLENELFEEIKSRIKEDDSSVPYLDNGYYYYTRFEKGKQYPIYCRKKDNLKNDEEILIDVNKMSQGHEYFRIGGIDISPNNKIMAYSVDTISRRLYTVHFKNLETGEKNTHTISNTSGGVSWANDNITLFYNQKNTKTLRTEKVMRHSFNQNQKDEEVYFEKDDEFNLYSYKSKSGKYIIIVSGKTISDEIRFLNANEPDGNFKIFQKRVDGLEYSIDHLNDKWYVRTNINDSKNFKLMVCDEDKTSSDNWKEFIKHRKNVLLEGVEVFNDYFVITERENGQRRFNVISGKDGESHYIDFEEEVFSAYSSVNSEINSNTFRYGYSSMTTPNSTIEYNLIKKTKTVLKEAEILGGTFDKNNYESMLVWADARDGKKVPISLVFRKDTYKKGKNPLLLYGYGSYGSTNSAGFSSVRLSLLDRGFVYAIAHIRGSQYLGREWYEDGKMFNKKNTFWDFIDSAKYLGNNSFVDKDHIFAMGGSAGGLLMGAIANMEPEVFKGIVAAVPFVDVVTTMLDETIPLTTFEFDEWGDPKDKDSYYYMLSYSPYDQVEEKDYPAIFITTGYHDSQVQYFEPAKWIARLRDKRTNKEPLLMYCNMDAGHGGASGRFEAYKETAMEYAFLISLTENK